MRSASSKPKGRDPNALCLLLSVLGVLGAPMGLGACSTVDLGDPPAEVNACRPSQMFFVDRIWPELLTKSYGGRTCGDATCHGSPTGPPPRIVMPTSTPTFPFTAQSDWEMSYRSVTQQLTCTNARGSELFTRPAGLSTHGGGQLFPPDGPEGVLLEMWVAASP